MIERCRKHDNHNLLNIIGMQGSFLVPAGHSQASVVRASSCKRSNTSHWLCSISTSQPLRRILLPLEFCHSSNCVGLHRGRWTLQRGLKRLLQHQPVGPAKGCRLTALATKCPPQIQTATPLQAFLAFLISNGVEGIGMPDSKIGVFETEEGQRGILCVEDVEEGEVIMRIPLRLAITDYPADEESNKLLGAGTPWSLRLAAKLLRHRAAGTASPWHMYLRILPEGVPSVWGSMPQDALSQLHVPHVVDEVARIRRALEEDYASVPNRAAFGNASFAEYQWARSIVQSRTFGSAAREGGVGVRMLVPLADLLNHGGDEAAFLLHHKPTQTDNVRWELVNPEESPSGEWEMVVVATRPISTGEEALHSYGERPNADFVVNYGFLPARNSHDAVVLFSSIDSALAWALSEFPPPGMEPQIMESHMAAARAAAQAEEPPPLPIEDKEILDDLSTLKLLPGARADARLAAALAALGGGGAAGRAYGRRALAHRCVQLLSAAGATPLQADLRLLAATAPEEERPYFASLLHYYSKAINKLLVGIPMESPLRDVLSGGGSSTKSEAVVQLKAATSESVLLAVQYRMYQKLICWDFVLELLGDLQTVKE